MAFCYCPGLPIQYPAWCPFRPRWSGSRPSRRSISGRRRHPSTTCRGSAPRSAAGRACSSSATMRFRSGSAETRSARSRSSRPRRIAEGADTLLSVGGVQSNSARVVAAVAARMGLRCVLVQNGARPDRLTANALLDGLLGAEVHYVESRADRAPTMARIAEDLRRQGRHPYEIPARRVDPARRAGVRPRHRRADRAGRRPRRHRPLDFVWRHAGRTGRRVHAPRPAHARAGHQRRRSRRCDPRDGADRDRGNGRPARRGRNRAGRCARDRGRRHSCRRRLRRAVGGVARSGGPAGAARGDVRRSHLHGQGARRADSPRAPRFVHRQPTVLFWHTGGQVGLFA